MLIERENLNAIKKRKILEIEHTKYTLSKYLIACYYLKKIIRNSVIDTFELIELLRKHYSGDILEAFKAITMEEYQEVRFNCYYLSKILKEKLNSFGIKTEYITYKSDGFSIDVGDDIIKESHISIVWPIRKNNEDIFIIFDPGLYIEKPLICYQNKDSKKIRVRNCVFQIKQNNDLKYPAIQTIDGVNDNTYSDEIYHIIKRMNPYYATINIEDVLYPAALNLILGFKISKANGKNSAYIKLIYPHEYLEFYTSFNEQKIKLTYSEIKNIPFERLIEMLRPCCKILNKNVLDVVDDIYFMIQHHKEYLDFIVNPKVRKKL